MRVAILDMQPIDPPVGGGRLRLLGLYHALGAGINATYVGTYDWPGESFRDQQMSPGLREIVVPLSPEHFRAAADVTQMVGGKVVIDSIFHCQAHLSPAYLDSVRQTLETADVVIYSHPWLYPLTAGWLDRKRQLVVYDAHNVEGKLRTGLLDDGNVGTRIAREVVKIECDLCRSADLVVACSHEDSLAFNRLYSIDPAKLRVMPNGAFTERHRPIDETMRSKAKKALKLALERPTAIFIGSAYAPNIEAARFITDEIAPACPDILLVIAGGVGNVLPRPRTQNVVITGEISEESKATWFCASDLALNPMFSGSGTNIKMFDFMAAGLPILSTRIGARGIETSEPAFSIASRATFSLQTRALCRDKAQRASLGAAAALQVRRFYSWERLSGQFGQILRHHYGQLNKRPKFSVIIPTYERHDLLSIMVQRLSAQDFKDFEVIIVDQSARPWPDVQRDFGLHFVYVHSDIRGAVTARNTGAQIASGEILAFTDDDCEPSPGWISAAAKCFDVQNNGIVGLEGLIVSDKIGDPDYRSVTNDGFEGIGFMTANLFIRSSIFQLIGGFDIHFENPHFREDTDLGWCAQHYGLIPFSREAWVFHPAQKRSIERESLPERSRFFVKDALLMAKHPERYTALFFAEQQWKHNPYFLHYFAQGLSTEGINLTPDFKRRMEKAGLTLPEIT